MLGRSLDYSFDYSFGYSFATALTTVLLLQADEVGAVVEKALRLGYRHIDEAAMYGNQEGVGRTFTKLFKEGKIKREDIWVTSKVSDLLA